MHTISAAESQKYAHMRQMNPHCTPTHEYKHKQQKINRQRAEMRDERGSKPGCRAARFNLTELLQ